MCRVSAQPSVACIISHLLASRTKCTLECSPGTLSNDGHRRCAAHKVSSQMHACMRYRARMCDSVCLGLWKPLHHGCSGHHWGLAEREGGRVHRWGCRPSCWGSVAEARHEEGGRPWTPEVEKKKQSGMRAGERACDSSSMRWCWQKSRVTCLRRCTCVREASVVALDVFAVVLTWQVQTVHTVVGSANAALHAHYSADSTVLHG